MVEFDAYNIRELFNTYRCGAFDTKLNYLYNYPRWCFSVAPYQPILFLSLLISPASTDGRDIERDVSPRSFL